MDIMNEVKISWYGKHLGEEPPLVGGDASASLNTASSHSFGAGGIFFTGCNLHCVFCQNFQISQQNLGKFYNIEQLVEIMLELQKAGAVNIDLVTPTIWYKQIKQALVMAKNRGLTIPIVWNSNGYEKVEIIKEVAGLVDIYLPDFKYSDDELAFKYSGIKNYVETAKLAIKEMLKQVGNLIVENGIAKKGLVVRHMVLPNNLANSFGVLQKLAEIDLDVHISLMNQYFPMHKAKNFPELMRVVNQDEFNQVYEYLQELGFVNGWVQGEKSQDNLIPDFTKEKPFK